MGPSLVEEEKIMEVASVETGVLDEVGGRQRPECHLVGHLEVESPVDQGLEPGGLQCPPKPSFFCKWRWPFVGERKKMVQEEVGPSVI